MTLPDREYYSLETLVSERWSKIWPEMTVDMVRHLIETNKLAPEDPTDEFSGYVDRDGIKYIYLEDVQRFEAEMKDSKDAVNAPYLDPSHEYYSEELATAVSTWLSLYGVGGKYKAKISHKIQIKNALSGKGLSDSAIDRIAVLVNPNKKGGAPAIDL
jgi:hypothetical protein